jgi:uncharacterized protein YneR
MLHRRWIMSLTLIGAACLASGCQSEEPVETTPSDTAAAPASTSSTTAKSEQPRAAVKPSAFRGRTPQHDQPGYVTFVRDERLWVFAQQSTGLQEFLETGEPGKNVTWIGAGPHGMSMRSDDADVLLGYTSAKPGFRTFVEDGRIWIFEENSEALAEFLAVGEPAKSVTWIGAGPRGVSIRGESAETLLAYLGSRPGFKVFVEDERLWVFEEGSEELKQFLAVGEPAKSVTWIGAGPRGVSLRGENAETLLAYVASRPGFRVFVEDERLWVFREGSEGLREYMTSGEPAKSVTLIGAGPRGRTIRSDERETLTAYLASF